MHKVRILDVEFTVGGMYRCNENKNLWSRNRFTSHIDVIHQGDCFMVLNVIHPVVLHGKIYVDFVDVKILSAKGLIGWIYSELHKNDIEEITLIQNYSVKE